jgi:predicted DsbA family dithiol-disulfide isomerase
MQVEAPEPAEVASSRAAVEVLCFTDPLCSWSWAMEPERQRLVEALGPALEWRSVMGGMIPDWQTYSDPMNAVHRPAQMGPQWYHVRTETGAPIDERIWQEDPPASSFPACLAVKAAGRQGLAAGERYLCRVWRAVMQERRNVARREVLLELAAELSAGGDAPFDAARFEHELDTAETVNLFREDLKETRYREIGRFPTLVFRGSTGPGVLLVGYRPLEVLRRAAEHVMAQNGGTASQP